jgi:hypothetical protein
MKDAKGHGSNPKGAHADGTDKVGQSPHISKRALNIITKYAERGFSVRPDGYVPKDGFQVAFKGRTEPQPLDPKGNIEQQVRDHVARNAGVYASPDTFIGGWNSPYTGKVHLEPSRTVQDPDVAFKLGQARNQVSIWDNKKGRDIPTGGDGKDGPVHWK